MAIVHRSHASSCLTLVACSEMRGFHGPSMTLVGSFATLVRKFITAVYESLMPMIVDLSVFRSTDFGSTTNTSESCSSTARRRFLRPKNPRLVRGHSGVVNRGDVKVDCAESGYYAPFGRVLREPV
ncbi:hypothetical protein A4G29_03450 [Mycobacterium kansasii]|nr:hypothetical protein A4G29_03450 [Mycobacterium kansasii]